MAAHARVRTRTASRPARRVSGPIPRPRPVPAGAPPLRRGSTGVFERIRALPETRLVDGLLRGRVWIWLIGILLGGIVAMQVSLLKLNAGISNAVTTTSTLERQNADIEAEIARLSSIERVRGAATADDMVTPAPGAVSFLRVRPDRDTMLAARRMEPPSESAAAVMANGGREPGVLAAQPPATDPISVGTPDPSTGATAATAPEATATPTPVPTATPPAATQDGATVAPQG
jgi:hypothetical protein